MRSTGCNDPKLPRIVVRRTVVPVVLRSVGVTVVSTSSTPVSDPFRRPHPHPYAVAARRSDRP